MKDLTVENVELKRQLEKACRILGLKLCPKDFGLPEFWDSGLCETLHCQQCWREALASIE